MKIKAKQGFDEQHVLENFTKLGDPLLLISKHIDFNLFKATILKYSGRIEE